MLCTNYHGIGDLQMKLLDDWKRVLKRAWSVRFAALAVAAEVMLQLWWALPSIITDFVPIRIATWLPLVLTVAAIGARFVKQKETPDATVAE